MSMLKSPSDHETLGDEYKNFVKDFADESDRAAVIVGTAKLDLLLYQILQRALFPIPRSSDELLDSEASLGTFSSRIHMAYRLALIDAQFARALHLIKKIRNSFAHEISSKDLSSGGHFDRIKELVLPFKDFPKYESFKKTVSKKHSGASADFRTAIAIVASRLERTLQRVITISCKHTVGLIPEKWADQNEKQ